MITHDFVFEVIVRVDPDKSRFISSLCNITQNRDQGEIQGDITKEDNRKVFIIETSEVNDDIIGIGMGYKFYVETIRKCFLLGCDEFRSSITRNDNSTNVWEKMYNSFYNVDKLKKYYSITKPIKQIL